MTSKINPAGSTPTGPPDNLSSVQAQRRLTLAILSLCALGGLLFAESWWVDERYNVHEAIEWAGLALIFICIFGRTWCTLYIGGRKKNTLVQSGPYSLVRNPLYGFSVIGAAGMGAQVGSIFFALLTALLAAAVFANVVRKEEAFLSQAFGQSFNLYAERVPRFLPRMSTWRDLDELTIKPTVVLRTFTEACLFLLAIPAAEAIEWAHRAGWLPVLLRLP